MSRSDAEDLVDVLERNPADAFAMRMAAELRELFGMAPWPGGWKPGDGNG